MATYTGDVFLKVVMLWHFISTFLPPNPISNVYSLVFFQPFFQPHVKYILSASLPCHTNSQPINTTVLLSSYRFQSSFCHFM